MRKTAAKKIRKIVQPTDAITRRVYRRMKKTYSRLSKNAKGLFLENLKALFAKT